MTYFVNRRRRYIKEFIDPDAVIKTLGTKTIEPTGFPNRTDSSMAFVNGTRTFTITPTSTYFEVFQEGVKTVISSATNVTITDVEGLHVIYFEGSDLISLANPTDTEIDSIIKAKPIASYIHWDATNSTGSLFDERHGTQMDSNTHSYLHFTVGMAYISGLALGDFDADNASPTNASAQFSVASGILSDEDIPTNVSAIGSTAGLPVWYRDGSNWRKTTNAGYSVITTGTGRLAWDNAGTLTEVTNNQFVNCHVIGYNETSNPIVAFVGQAEYASVHAAREGVATELASIISAAGLPTPEMKAIGSVIFQTSDSYGGSPVKARVRVTDLGDNYVDCRTNPFSQSQGPISHSNLAGLANNDHAFYLDRRVEPLFLAYNNATISNVTGDGTTYFIIFNAEEFDIDNNFNTTTGEFTAPVNGYYSFNVNIGLNGLIEETHGDFFLRLDVGSDLFLLQCGKAGIEDSGSKLALNGSCIAYMAASTVAKVAVDVAGSAKTVDILASAFPGTVRTFFSGQRVG